MKRKLIIHSFICLMLISTQAFSQLLKIDPNSIPKAICEGETDTLRVVPTFGKEFTPISFKWTSKPPTAFSVDDISATVTAKPAKTTMFYITVKDLKYPAIIFTDSLEVRVTEKPVFFAGDDTILCINTPLQLMPELPKGGICKWTHNGKGRFTNPNIATPLYIPAPGESGYVKLVLTVNDYEYCHEIKDSLYVGYIEPPFVEIQPPVKKNICLDTKYLLTVDTKNISGVKIKWRKESGYGKILDAESTTMTYVPDPYDHGTVLFIVDAYLGGCHNADSISVPITPIIFEYIPPSLTFCEGKTEFLCVTPCNGCRYKWSTGDTTNCIVIKPTVNTTYMVEVTNREGCYRKDTIDIIVKKSPVIDSISFIPRDVDKITVYPPGEGRYIFSINGKVEKDSEENFFEFGKYVSVADTVDIMVCNEDCCIEIPVPLPVLKCPNAFSPNGDGINDKLLQGRKIVVFDRTEKILYQGWEGWDGTFNGRQMPEGTYFYIIFDKENNVYCKTPVTLLRKILTK